MSAHVPRRVFAAPFVATVTVGLGTLGAAACNGAGATPPAQQPETTASAAPSATTSSAPADPPLGAASWKVTKVGSECEADREVVCNTSMPCTPHPKKYACPPEVTRYPTTVARKAGATDCTVRVVPDMSCPPNVNCNPPPPHDVTVPCPP